MTLLERLSAPFPPATVSWRVGAITKDKSKGMALAYIDARDVQDRLNEVCGHEWQVKHHYCGGQMLACEIGIKIDGEWLWRGDGAGAIEPAEESKRLEEEQDMARKAAFSDSFKRAAVRWGIGRYLYDIDSPWVALEQKGSSYVIAPNELARLRSALKANVEATRRGAGEDAGARYRETERALSNEEAAAKREAHIPSSTGEGETLSQIRDRVHRALELSNTTLTPAIVLKTNQADLAFIKRDAPNTHTRLLAYAEERSVVLGLKPSQPPRPTFPFTGSSPELMGEP